MSKAIAASGLGLLSLRWAARFASIVSIAIILLFFIGEGFNPAKVASREWLGLLFFPLGVMAGMVVAWWKEGLGAAITLASLLAFYLVYGLLLSGRLSGGPAFIVLTAPGFLFLAHWLLEQKAK